MLTHAVVRARWNYRPNALRMYLCMCVYICMHVCMYVCMYTYIHTCICIHVHVYVYTGAEAVVGYWALRRMVKSQVLKFHMQRARDSGQRSAVVAI